MSARSIRRVAALGAVLATGVTAAPALAHAPVLGTTPGKGATVTNVRTVSVRFGEAVVTGLITVKHTNGSAVAGEGERPRQRQEAPARDVLEQPPVGPVHRQLAGAGGRRRHREGHVQLPRPVDRSPGISRAAGAPGPRPPVRRSWRRSSRGGMVRVRPDRQQADTFTSEHLNYRPAAATLALPDERPDRPQSARRAPPPGDPAPRPRRGAVRRRDRRALRHQPAGGLAAPPGAPRGRARRGPPRGHEAPVPRGPRASRRCGRSSRSCGTTVSTP